jgi:peptide/nickel transport system permease protein
MTATMIPTEPSSKSSGLFRRIFSHARDVPWLPSIILLVIVIAALFAPLLTSYSPTDTELTNALKPPGGDHLFGTDDLGRDYFSRLLYGARVSLIVVVACVVIAAGVGLIIGIVSGFVGGIFDAVLMRLTDAFMGLPSILIALVFVESVGQGLNTVITALVIVGWAPFARIIRSEVLSLKERQFVALARIAGASEIRIMMKHIFPNVFNTLVVIASLQMSRFVLSEAGLSFLGAGVPRPTPTWGNMISDGLPYMTTAWWLSVIPGFALLLLVFAMNIFADWLRDALDPRLRQV